LRGIQFRIRSTSDGYEFRIGARGAARHRPGNLPTACAANIGKTHDETGIWMVQRNSYSGPPASELRTSSPQVVPESSWASPAESGRQLRIIRFCGARTAMRLIEKALTFDDVLLVTGLYGRVARETDLSSRFSRRIELKLPLVSAAMDTVTDSRLAIALAQEGGLGILHKNLSPRQQAAEVLKVKRHEAGVLRDPITIGPDMKIRDVIELNAPAPHFRLAGGRRAEGDRRSSPTATCASRRGWTRPCERSLTSAISCHGAEGASLEEANR